jgi:hypothetical protein
MRFFKYIVEKLLWCFGKGGITMPILMIDPVLLKGQVPIPPVTAPVDEPSAVLAQDDTPPSIATLRKQTFVHLMRCFCELARKRVFGRNAGGGCVLASRYLSEPETDAWGALAMILSLTHERIQHCSMDSMDQETLAVFTGIVSVCLKFACGEEIRPINYGGIEIGLEVQILGVLSGHHLLQWMDEVHLYAKKLQTVLDAEVVAILRSVNLHWHYVDNAQARAERLLFKRHQSVEQNEHFDIHALHKALRALPTFYFACVYDDLFILPLPERHASAMVFAILASGDYTTSVVAQPGLVLAESREVLAAVLRAEPELPNASVFANGGRNPHDEWATRARVKRAYDLLSQY